MTPILRMPTEDEVPKGPRREFVAELHWLYREAKRPQLRKASDWIRQRNDLAGTASKETIRRMLRGKTIPRDWDTVEAVLVAFCELAGFSPDRDRDPSDRDPWEPSLTIRQTLLRDWNDAIEAIPDAAVSSDSPTANTPPARNGFHDEPPF